MGQKSIKGLGVEEIGGSEKLKKVQIPIPKLKERDLLVKVLAVAANPVDYKKRAIGIGHQGKVSSKNPMVLGFDAVGIVVKKGSQANLYNIDDKIFYAGDLTKCGSNCEFQVVDERIVGKMPKSINNGQAAGFPLVTLTAWEGLEYQMNIKQNSLDKSILVIGGAGGVGSMIIQLAKVVFGLKVIATASRQETIEHCKKLGADYVINHYKNLSEQLTPYNIPSVDYVYCTSDLNDNYIKEISAIIKPFGYVCTITGSDSSPLNIDPLKAKSVKIVHELMFTRSMFQMDMEKQKSILDRLSELIDKNKIQPIVNQQLPFNLENLKYTHEACQQSKNIGKISLIDVDTFFNSVATTCL